MIIKTNSIDKIWIIYILIFIILIDLVIYLRYFRNKQETFNDAYLFLKILIVSAIIFFIIWIFLVEIIVIEMFSDNEIISENDIESEKLTIERYMYTILTSLLIGMYFGVCGFFKTQSVSNFKIIFVVLLVVCYVYFNTQFTYYIIFNQPISNYLEVNKYCSSSEQGLIFFGWNILLFLLIFGVSLITETEVSK